MSESARDSRKAIVKSSANPPQLGFDAEQRMEAAAKVIESEEMLVWHSIDRNEASLSSLYLISDISP
jgi:hypothetical protein